MSTMTQLICNKFGGIRTKNAIFSKITFLTVRPTDGLTSRKPASFLTTETTLQEKRVRGELQKQNKIK